MASISLVSSDLNGTLVQQHTMADMIRWACPDQPERYRQARRLFEEQTCGRISIAAAFTGAGPLSAGISLAQAIDYARFEMKYHPGFGSLLDMLGRRKVALIINTTGYSVTCRVIEKRFGHASICGYICNQMEFAPEGRPFQPLEEEEMNQLIDDYIAKEDPQGRCQKIKSTGRIRLTIDDEAEKMQRAQKWAARLNIAPDHIAHVGDTMGDSAAIQAAAEAGGIGIAFNYNRELGAFVDRLQAGPRLAGGLFKIDPREKGCNLKNLIPILFPVPAH